MAELSSIVCIIYLMCLIAELCPASDSYWCCEKIGRLYLNMPHGCKLPSCYKFKRFLYKEGLPHG